MTRRIFDHLDGSQPEDKRFSRVAHAMVKSTWWRTIPLYVEPEPVAGETRGR